MATIRLETYIEAPIERVFDLSRSIDLHKLSTESTNEKAIAGKTSGLIGLGETVTWRAKHLGFYQNLTVQIVEYERPVMFADKMLKGAFASMHHIHQFETVENGTKMRDVFEFSSPFGILGKLVNSLFLKQYMTRFLIMRNQTLKEIAESEKWKTLINE